MPRYLIGIIIAFFTPVLHGWANVLDSYLSNTLFKRLTTLIFFSAAINVLFLPCIWIFGLPHILSTQVLGFTILISVIDILYQYPYYLALKKADTSIVVSMFCFGEILVPFFAFWCAGEHLNVYQYIGYFVIISSATLLAIDIRTFRISRAAWLMLAVSVMLSLQSIAYKYVFEHGGDWVSIVSWSALLDFIFAGIAALYSGHLKDIAKQYAHHKNKIGSLFIIMQFLTWAGEQTQSFAISLIPVSIVKGVDNAQAIFVFLIAIAFSKRFPQLFQENLATSLRKKIILFAAMIVGILYTIFG